MQSDPVEVLLYGADVFDVNAGVVAPILIVTAMNQLFRFSTSVEQDPAIDTWMEKHSGDLGAIARHWFEVMRKCGDDVRELLHDGHPVSRVVDKIFGGAEMIGQTRLLSVQYFPFYHMTPTKETTFREPFCK